MIDALYQNTQVALSILLKDPEAYIESLATSLCAPESKPFRAILRSHLTFLANHFVPALQSKVGDVMHKIFFPFLLFSKPRQKTADVAWEIIADSEENGGLSLYEPLAGCVEIWKNGKASEQGNAVEKMAILNLAFASKIAGNSSFHAFIAINAHSIPP